MSHRIKFITIIGIFTFNCVFNAHANTANDIYRMAQQSPSRLTTISDIDTLDNSRNTALCNAILNDDVATYNTLVKYGADKKHECVKNISKNKYDTFIAKTNGASSKTFLGLGKWGWGAIGASVLGGAAVAASSGGSGGGSGGTSSAPSTETNNGANSGQAGITNKDDEAKLIFTYSEYDMCPNGYEKGSKYTLSTGENIYKCDKLAKCPYSTTSCGTGYHETGNSCQSGEILYKECKENVCPYTTTGCAIGYHETGKTCQSGNVLYKECEPIECGAHATWSPSGCVCNNGWTGDNCDTSITCPYTTTSCTGGYRATGNTCLSGDTLYRECEPIECGAHATWTETGCICNDGYGNFHMGDGCIDLSNCGNNAYSDGHNCVCETGFTNWTRANGCSPLKTTLVIDNNLSEDDIVGLYNPRFASVGVFDYDIMYMDNSTNSNVIGILVDDSEVGNYGGNLKYGGKIYITNNGNGDIYGLKHINIFDGTKTSNSSDTENFRYADGNIIIRNTGDGDVYGIYSQTDSSYTNRDDLTTNLNIKFNAQTDTGWNFYSSATININNTGGGNVYGMKGRTLYNTYLSLYRSSNFTDLFQRTLGTINIENNGIGTVYGMYVDPDRNSPWYAANATCGVGQINILNHGNGNAFGMYSEIINIINAAPIWSQLSTTGEINITNYSDGNAYGMYGRYLGNAAGNNYASGTIHITNESTGDAYGMFSVNTIAPSNSGATNASSHGNGLIKILNKGSGNVYGMFGFNLTNADTSSISVASGTIDLVNYGNGGIYGMYGNNTMSNASSSSYTSVIKMQNLDGGTAIGLYVNNGIADNSGEIHINNTGTGGVIGIFGDINTTINNSGIITITRDSYTDEAGTIHIPTTEISGDIFGIYAKSGSKVNNSGTINIASNGNVYGIYLENGATVTNTGVISIDGVSCDGIVCSGSETYGNHIILNGASLINAGIMSAKVLNLDSMGGNVVATNGAQFIAENDISGTLSLSSDIVADGFDTTYTAKNMIQAGDTSKLTLRSGSAMFGAKLANNGNDVVMTMKSFDTLTDNKSLAAYLADNYARGTSAEFFGGLKSSANMVEFNNILNGLSGMNAFTQFDREDMSAMREINFSMNQQMFMNGDRDEYDVSGSMERFSFSNSSNGGSGSYGISNSRMSDRWKLGYGLAMANIGTNDDLGTSRSNQIGLFYMPITYTGSDIEFISTPRVGFAKSHYNRRGYNNMNYDGYIEKQIFGFNNDLRYPVTFGNWTIAPDLGFNAIMYRQSGHESDQAFSLIIPSDEIYSLEAGLCLFTKYERKLNNGYLRFNSGVMLYRELADTYNMKLGIRGLDGTFNLYDDAEHDYSGAATIGFDYKAGRLDVYGRAQYFVDGDAYTNVKAGFRLHF